MSGNDTPERREPAASPASADDLSGRLRRLDAELDRKQEATLEAKAGPGPSARLSGLGRAFRMSSEFIAGIIAGAGLGWLFDYLLGTSPWGLTVFLLLGFAAGVFNLLRAASSLEEPSGPDSRPMDP